MQLKTLKQLQFNNTFHHLGKPFYSKVQPQGISRPFLVAGSRRVARLIGLDPDEIFTPYFVDLFSGQALLPGFQALAMVYSGHQFGFYSPQLGDGRALLLGEVDGETGKWDLSLKGAGMTPYSRSGDGRSVLRSSIREFLCSEAMAGLGIPTTRALCVIGGEDPVYRETLEKSATLVRVTESHVRFGTFEYFHYSEKPEVLKRLADYVISHHFPEALASDEKYPHFFGEVIRRTAVMIAHWQAIGFAHGVMNTDNMSILGQTFDYGPFGFMEDYDPGYICNHSDVKGRYAFQHQPAIGLTNLNALGYALSSLMPNDDLIRQLQEYEPTLDDCYAGLMRKKMGLLGEHKEDPLLWTELLQLMENGGIDYTILFRTLSEYSIGGENPELRKLFKDQEAFGVWLDSYQYRLKQQEDTESGRQARMKAANPKYILRNYLAQRAIEKAEKEQDYSEVNRLLFLLYHPFDEQEGMGAYAEAPPDWGKSLVISCSS